jgi:hypothetical protein
MMLGDTHALHPTTPTHVYGRQGLRNTRDRYVEKSRWDRTNADAQTRLRKSPVIRVPMRHRVLEPARATVASSTVGQRHEKRVPQFYIASGNAVFYFHVWRFPSAPPSRLTPHTAHAAGASQNNVIQTQDPASRDMLFSKPPETLPAIPPIIARPSQKL